MIHNRSIERNAGLPFRAQQYTPTISVYPYTTLGNVAIPLEAFRSPVGPSRGFLYDTPGIQGASAYLSSLVSHEYMRNVSLQKVAGFQRPAEKLKPGTFVP
jgi:hypothetical protein